MLLNSPLSRGLGVPSDPLTLAIPSPSDHCWLPNESVSRLTNGQTRTHASEQFNWIGYRFGSVDWKVPNPNAYASSDRPLPRISPPDHPDFF